VSLCLPLVLSVTSPSARFTKIITAPRTISQNSPMSQPDFAKTYGSPKIPAPIIVPVRVNVVAQNFLFIHNPRIFFNYSSDNEREN